MFALQSQMLSASVTGHVGIVEHLIGLPIVSRDDKIAALELLGATYVDKKRDMVNALQFWRRAMEERYVDLEEVLFCLFISLSHSRLLILQFSLLHTIILLVDTTNSQLFQSHSANQFQPMTFPPK